MSLVSGFVRFCVGLRYKVHVEGEEILKKYKDTSILFLANHPATIDPVIVLSSLEPYVFIQPLAAERFFKSPFIHFFLKKLKAHPVPEFETGNNEYKAYKVEKLLHELKNSFKSKDKILLYPAGHIADSTFEKLGGASFAFELKDVPKKVIGIATDGLHGSIFSRYFELSTAPFLKMLIKGFKILLLNGLFFVPKRKVVLQIFEIDQNILNLKDKLAFNKAMDEEFNSRLTHVPSIVSYGVCKTPIRKEKTAIKKEPIDKKLGDELIKIAEKVTKKKVKLNDHLSYDVGIDSLELAEILTILEQKYAIRIDEMPETLQELGIKLKENDSKTLEFNDILKPRGLLNVKLMEAQNLLEAFYAQSARSPYRRMGYDQTLKELTFKKAVMIIELMAKEIASFKGSYIAVILPSSLMAYLLMFAVMRADKVPVMLNWTGGRKSLDFAIELLKIEVILSSEKFLDKAFNVDLGPNFEKVYTLEKSKQGIGFSKKLQALLASFTISSLKNKISKKIDSEDVACILFTSGSESMPKAVPLTHTNILFDIASSLKTGLVHDNDRFLATLPPFHSFGSVISGFLPMVTGLEVVYMPDPTDSIAIACAINQFKATLFCSAPSFLKQILIYAHPKQLDSLRLVVVGAEKLQDPVKLLFNEKCHHAVLLEGYGITECGPIVTLQRNAFTKGVGIPIQGVELLIVDPDSLTPLPLGSEGEILIHGKNIFKGYLGIKKDPFIEIDNKIWYRSGDRGKLSPQHELILGGRFKRFVKISAEMISLGALEEALEDYRHSSTGVAQFALMADKGTEKLVLITIYPDLDLDEINNYLRHKGMPKVAKISSIKVVKAINQLATGKIDYRSLEHEIT